MCLCEVRIERDGLLELSSCQLQRFETPLSKVIAAGRIQRVGLETCRWYRSEPGLLLRG